jgi:hypothetical protein
MEAYMFVWTVAHIALLCAAQRQQSRQHRADHNGGSACGYQDVSAPSAIPATAEQAAGQTVCLCIASAGRERPLLPHLVRV